MPGSPAHAGIDRRPCRSPASRSGLPRTRGDRPGGMSPSAAHVWAPPHTRGSTRLWLSHLTRLTGSPAHAGIDPAPAASGIPLAGLPRTRGDRPPSSHSAPCAPSAPPHTRGSTPLPPVKGLRLNGSPAHAGIDRDLVHAEVLLEGLPRTRGDRPWQKSKKSSRCRAPPHTRGSTWGVGEVGDEFEGSPAHAGIDPVTFNIQNTQPRLPRTRGDRPIQNTQPIANLSAPPHTRGSTWRGVSERCVAVGSPAHAGIDLAAILDSAIAVGLPRTRGDRPRPACGKATYWTAPPHTRGSTW